MPVRKKRFGTTADGQTVYQFIMTNRTGHEVRFINYGAAIISYKIPGYKGHPIDIVLGYDSLADYENQSTYLGSVVGRYANRIAQARFELNGKRYDLIQNDHINHLHGGSQGFDKKVWQAQVEGERVVMAYSSPNGEEGYPGKLDVKVTYSFDHTDALVLDYEAQADEDTLCNLTNHCYFNLNGHNSGLITDHAIEINADYYTPTDIDLIPTGEIAKVENTLMDFTHRRRISTGIDAPFEQIRNAGGYDHNWVIRGEGMREAANIISPESGIHMHVSTTMPGIQFYTGNFLEGDIPGKDGANYCKRSGFCLETQHFPNSPNIDHFPNAVLKKGEKYHHTTVYYINQKE